MKETTKTIEKNNETKSWFLKKINKIDNSLISLRKKEDSKKKSEMKKDTLQLITQN